ncbi:hypothetical protein RS130_16450 [Paraglaciecola aquimarina]|uniref:Uncharacterized protein n=1 Tax=Paraglaciecola aquimarina TaxID=1235557 RepID=A0ABU3SZ37_9ALTE|nr:hypothetical protein [Paraglaciecola aquimarina]MDU0355285.1 hypothetical protein [Paraglaciecola aquimarina]
MLGIALKVDETDKFLEVDIDPSLLETNIDAKALFNLVSNSEYSNFFIFDEDIINVISNCKNAKANHDNRIITKRIGERRDSDIKCTIREDELSASLT